MSGVFGRPVAPGAQPAYDHPAYKSTHARAPGRPLVPLPSAATELAGPRFAPSDLPPQVDLSSTAGRAALGERILVAGRVSDENDRPVSGALIELWQANAAGRYHHDGDTHDAPLDPGFRGSGRVFTDGDGGYRFTSIRPGAYPWGNHHNAWRPAHIHFSLFGASWASRLVTQMYFPGDPLLELDPIYHAVPDEAARRRLVARFDLELAQPAFALGYRFDIVLGGPRATPR